MLDRKEKRKTAIDLVATRYSVAKTMNGGKVPIGSFQKILEEVLRELSIPDETIHISQATVLSRIRRKNLLVDRPGPRSPMEKVEPVILKFALWKQEAGQPITSGEGIELATSLIKGTPVEKEVQAFQKSRHRKSTSWCLTNQYWRAGFMKRNAVALSRAKGNRIAACRSEWTTFENIVEMYNLVYDQMVDAGLAKKLSPEDQYWTDDHGSRVETEAEAFGSKIEVEITHPEWILFGDEVGTDINQKEDGQIAGTNYCIGKGTRANIKSSTNGGRFTVIGLTAASGDAVMCIVIFAAEELTYEQRMGHDIRAVFDGDGSIRDNTGHQKSFPGAPTCHFRGKDVPALIACSPKGSITSEILKEAFQRLDCLKIYERVPGGPTPFVLLDAHDSRLQVPFLRYVNEEEHKWKVCIGLPNGTGKWQVGDSSEQNGQWKTEMTREKGKLILHKTRIGMETVIAKSDAIPLINLVWPKSFARKTTNQKAIRDRGWYPANRKLLHDPEILKTKTIGSTADIPPANNQAADESNTTTHNPTDPGTQPPTRIVTTGEPIVDDDSEISNVSGASSSSTTSTTRKVLDNLNFDEGMAGEFALDILQHLVKKESVCDNLHSRYERGRSLREKIKDARRLTGGALFKVKHIALDEEVLALREAKEQEKVDERYQVVKNAIDEYNKRKTDYEQVINSPKNVEDYVGADYKAIVHYKKRKGDTAVPSLVSKLKERYDETQARPDLCLTEYLADRGYEGEDVDRVITCVTTEIMGTVQEGVVTM